MKFAQFAFVLMFLFVLHRRSPTRNTFSFDRETDGWLQIRDEGLHALPELIENFNPRQCIIKKLYTDSNQICCKFCNYDFSWFFRKKSLILQISTSFATSFIRTTKLFDVLFSIPFKCVFRMKTFSPENFRANPNVKVFRFFWKSEKSSDGWLTSLCAVLKI